MEGDIEKQIQARFAELPEDIQKAISANDLESRITLIGKRHQLHIDQMGELGDEALMVMFGFSNPSDFANRIQKQLHIYPEQADKIADDMQNEIFLPIRESMKQFMERQERAQTPPPQPPTAFGGVPLEAVTPAPVVPLPPPPTPPISSVDTMLTQKTITTSKPAVPPTYKTDPYREPVE